MFLTYIKFGEAKVSAVSTVTWPEAVPIAVDVTADLLRPLVCGAAIEATVERAKVSVSKSVLVNVSCAIVVAIVYFFSIFFSTVPSSYIKNSNWFVFILAGLPSRSVILSKLAILFGSGPTQVPSQ